MSVCAHCNIEKDTVEQLYFYKQSDNNARAFRKLLCDECKSIFITKFKYQLAS